MGKGSNRLGGVVSRRIFRQERPASVTSKVSQPQSQMPGTMQNRKGTK